MRKSSGNWKKLHDFVSEISSRIQKNVYELAKKVHDSNFKKSTDSKSVHNFFKKIGF